MQQNDKLIIGTVQLGLDYGINNQSGKPSPDAGVQILKTAYASGVRTLDTAEAYGNAIDVIGLYNVRENGPFNIISKFGALNESTNLIESLEQSLKKLNATSIYAYLFHSPSDLKKLDVLPQVSSQLQQLKEQGLVKKIGTSVYTNADFKDAIENPHVDIIQFPFNVFDNNNKRLDVLKYAKEKGKEVHCRSVFLQGLIYKNADTLPEKLMPMKKYLDAFYKIASELNVSATELALNYALMNPFIDKVLIGVDSEKQLRENLSFTKSSLTQNDLTKIDTAINVTEENLLYPYNWN